MTNHTPHLLVSVDPGSSKPWVVASCLFGLNPEVSVRSVLISDLGAFADELCSAAEVGFVSLSLDAPVRVFGGVQSPKSLNPLYTSTDSVHWPFDVNPFSRRPCEKALTSKPALVNCSLLHTDLTKAIAKLCHWNGEFRDNAKFVDIHKGAAIRGYMGAPHAPVVRTFLRVLTDKAAMANVAITYDPESAGRRQREIIIMETHPAVALAFYAAQETHGFPTIIEKYKPVRGNRAVFQILQEAVEQHANSAYNAILRQRIMDDDALGAVVGLFNLLDLAKGRGDIFGTVETGYFLVPRAVTGLSFRELWHVAAAQVIATVQQQL